MQHTNINAHQAYTNDSHFEKSRGLIMRAFVMLYGLFSYLFFLVVFLGFIAFSADIAIPTITSLEVATNPSKALLINLSLILLWGIQHSVMARSWFKAAIAGVVPHHLERSTYVLISSIVLLALIKYWQSMEGVIWHVESITGRQILWSLFGFGWWLILLSTFLTDHFDLFGLRQTWLYLVKKSYTDVGFTQSFVYGWIRHPMMLGILISFWSIPTMTKGHLVFSLGMSFYVLVGIYFEEKSLAKSIGQQYNEYQKRTAKLVPGVY